MSKESLIGQSILRVDGKDKLTGQGIYAADQVFPGMLYGKVLRSPFPHARIRSIDTREAENLPGLVKVATAKDVPGLNRFGRAIPDTPCLADTKVRYVGDAVAVVAAESEEIAEQALRLIRVDYEELPPVFDPREASEVNAPKVHEEHESNVLTHIKIRKGDIEKGFMDAAVVVENTYVTPFVEHVYLEPECALAYVDAGNTVTIETPTQAPFNLRDILAQMLNLPCDQVRVKQTVMGGGFGGRTDSSFEIGTKAALLAYLTKRPVKILYSRKESILCSSKRHASIIRYKTGADSEGRLTAIDVRVYLNKGAYASVGAFMPEAGGLTTYMAVHLSGPYEVPHAKIDVYNVYTNNPYGSPMRGYSIPQATFAFESQLEQIAEKLGMDPVEIRLKNGLEVGKRTATGQLLEHSVGLKETIRKAVALSGWKELKSSRRDVRSSKRRGVGISSSWHGNSSGRFPDWGGAYLYLQADGKMELHTGIAEMGQGAKTVFSQIAAAELGVTPENIVAPEPDTFWCPDSMTTTATRSTVVVGNATIKAAQDARHFLLEVGASILGTERDALEIRENRVVNIHDPQSHISLSDLAKYCVKGDRRLIGKGFWQVPRPVFDRETGQGRTHHAFTFITVVAEVEVDVETGEVTVLKMTAVPDVGKAINPLLVEGQVEGGVVMGMGYALMEEIQMDKGYILNPSLTDYLIPTTKDVPPIALDLVEEPNLHGPFGAKGIGEPPVNPVAAAIANAVYDAIGVRITELPMTPERVLQAIKGKGEGLKNA
jgi:nicotinate dehydrogenase large molybdopterin subunit